MKLFKEIGKTIGKTKIKLKKNTPAILTGATVAGIFATGLLSARAGWKAKEDLDRIRDIREDEPTTFQKVRVTVKNAALPTAVAVATTLCAIKNHKINKETQEQLIASYLLLDRTFKEYKQEVRNRYGVDADDDILKKLNDSTDDKEDGEQEKPLFYDRHGKRFFNLSWEEIRDAEYQLNRLLSYQWYVSLNDFYSYLGLDWLPEADNIGWSTCTNLEGFEAMWVDVYYTPTKTDDGLECYILEYQVEPSEDFLG